MDVLAHQHLATLRAQAARLERYGGALADEAAALRTTIQALEETLAISAATTETLRQERDQERSRFNAILDHLPIGLLLVDVATSAITHYNPQATELLGHGILDTSDLDDFTHYHAIHPDGRPYTSAEYPLAKVLAGHGVQDVDVWYHMGSGSARLLHVMAAPIYDMAGALIMAVATFVDVTAHHQAAQERQHLLRQTQAAQNQAEAERAHLHRLLEQAPAAICIVQGPDYRYTLANDIYCRLLGRRRSEVEGQFVRAVFPEYVGQGVFQTLDGVWTTGEVYSGQEERLQVARALDGALEERYFNFIYAPIRESEGGITHIFAHGVEVTALVVAREEAQTAVQMRDQFLSVAAHELRTPLTTLLGYAELLYRRAERDLTSNEANRRAFIKLISQAQRLRMLVDTLLDVTRMDFGLLRLNLHSLDLYALTLRVVEEVRITLHIHALELVCDTTSMLVVGDAVRLEQVIYNLIQNAIKYSMQGGAITVQLQEQGEQVCLTVTDQGIGIPVEELPHLFERFVRVIRPGIAHIGGMGLGLFVVQDIVTLHGGSVTVRSTEGVGSTFTVCLPREGPGSSNGDTNVMAPSITPP